MARAATARISSGVGAVALSAEVGEVPPRWRQPTVLDVTLNPTEVSTAPTTRRSWSQRNVGHVARLARSPSHHAGAVTCFRLSRFMGRSNGTYQAVDTKQLGWKRAAVVALVVAAVGGVVSGLILAAIHDSPSGTGATTTTPLTSVTTATSAIATEPETGSSSPVTDTRDTTTGTVATTTPASTAPPREHALRARESTQSLYSGNWEDNTTESTSLAYVTNEYVMWSQATDNWIDFDLLNRYATFTAVVGQTVNSRNRDAVFRFTVDVDGRRPFDMTLAFGETASIDVKVRGATHLRLQITRTVGGADSYGGFADTILKTS